MRVDYHVHTEFSDDSTYPMIDCIKDAIDHNIDELCFTDHVDYGIKLDWDQQDHFKTINGQVLANVDYPRYFAAIQSYQQQFDGQITLKKGLEFGVQTHTIPLYEHLLETYPLDFVILSIHQIDDLEFWTQDYQRNKTQTQYNQGYYQALLDVVNAYDGYSVLGHMDLINRYDQHGIYPFELVEPYIAEILKIVIKQGKGIELNTSSVRYGLKDSTPSKAILSLYKDLGGTILTIGSDSHQPSHLGVYIDQAKEYLKSIGFQYYCTYDAMVPSFHPLDR